MTARILFLCAQQSSRALLAASLLHAQGKTLWEVWSTPPRQEQETPLVERVLQERGMALLPPDHLILPVFGMRWDQGIVLCSGTTDTGPLIPGAGRHQLWSVEDAPDLSLALDEQLAGYRRLLAILQREIRMRLLLTNQLALFPQRK